VISRPHYYYIISLLLKQERFPGWAYVITSRDNLYHTNHITHTVSCHKINGDKLWEFQDVAIIREPHGVAVDRDLNVYAVSKGNSSVVVISLPRCMLSHNTS
jgi:DNA-binding beta-propeller fold protein YncE